MIREESTPQDVPSRAVPSKRRVAGLNLIPWDKRETFAANPHSEEKPAFAHAGHPVLEQKCGFISPRRLDVRLSKTG